MSLDITKDKFNEAVRFLERTKEKIRANDPTYADDLNAFINSIRNVRYALKDECKTIPEFEEWFKKHPVEAGTLVGKFRDLRNVSVKERSVRLKKLRLKTDFGPEGLKVSGNGRVESERLRTDQPFPTMMTYKVTDDNGERYITTPMDIEVIIKEPTQDKGDRIIQFDDFFGESEAHLRELHQVITEADECFFNKQS